MRTRPESPRQASIARFAGALPVPVAHRTPSGRSGSSGSRKPGRVFRPLSGRCRPLGANGKPRGVDCRAEGEPGGENMGFGAALRVPEFRALWLAEALSVFGDQVARVALALLVFGRTGSAALTALTYALTFVPMMLGVLLVGLADRYPRRSVLVGADVLRAALAAAMAVPGLPLWLLWCLVGVLALAGSPFKAAQLALLPDVLGHELYQV